MKILIERSVNEGRKGKVKVSYKSRNTGRRVLVYKIITQGWTNPPQASRQKRSAWGSSNIWRPNILFPSKFSDTRSPRDKTKHNKAIKNLNLWRKKQRFQQYLEELSPTEATEYSLWKAASKLKKEIPGAHPAYKKNWWLLSKEWQRKEDVLKEHLIKIQPFPSEIASDAEYEILQALKTSVS